MDYASDSQNSSESQPTTQPSGISGSEGTETETNPEDKKDSGQVPESARCDLFFSNINVCAEKTWLVGPLIPGNGMGAILKFQFFEKNSKEILKAAEVKISFWSHMMHENDYQDDVVVDRELENQGIWVFKKINLSCMGADWDVIVRLKLESNDWQSTKFVWTQLEFLGE